MSQDNAVPRMRFARTVVIAICLGACGELAAPPRPKDPLSDQLILYALLLPDTPRHHVLVAPADGIARPDLSGVELTIRKRVEGGAGGEWALVGQWQDPYEKDCELMGVVPLFVNLLNRGAYCFKPEARLRTGALYRVEARADERATARGETRIVGDFEVTGAALSSRALSAQWTSSVVAHRYFMGLRRIADPTCFTCARSWYSDVDGTKFDGSVPQHAVEAAGSHPILEVVAVERSLHGFLTTGHEGALHDVHPVQNVTGGFGVVGSMLSRGRAVERR